MDRLINVKIGGSHLWKDSKLAGVQHEANVTRLRVSFDEGWDGFAKKVTFWDAKGLNPVERTLTVDLLEDITKSTRIYLFPIPGEAMTEAGMMSFVIEGYVDGKVARTVGTELEVEYSPKADNAGQPADPTPSQAEQLQVQIENIIGDMQEQAIIATDAANNAKTSEDNAKASEEAAERAQQAVENMTVTGEIVDPHSNLPALERSVEDGVVHLHLNIRQGFSGVYVGDGEMPEGYNVKVNPNGGGASIPAMIEDALTAAKESGEFDGPPGPEGPTGIPGADGADGPAGPPGVSGVYVGSGDMPAEYNVQVDPSGEALEIPPQPKLMLAADYDAVTDWSAVLGEGEIAWRCE